MISDINDYDNLKIERLPSYGYWNYQSGAMTVFDFMKRYMPDMYNQGYATNPNVQYIAVVTPAAAMNVFLFVSSSTYSYALCYSYETIMICTYSDGVFSYRMV